MAWIESHQSLRTHRKTMKLKRLLGIREHEVVGYLHILWWWALDNAPDGNLEGLDSKDLADVIGYRGDPEKLSSSLVAAGFMDAAPLSLHDWGDYAGKLIDRRKANTERNRRYRSASHEYHERVTSPSRDGATVPNSTQPNPTTTINSSSNNQSPEDKEILLIWLGVHLFKERMPSMVKAKELLSKLREEHPDLDMVTLSKEWAAYKIGKPLMANSNPASQLYKWMANAEKYEKERQDNESRRKPGGTKDQHGPMEPSRVGVFGAVPRHTSGN